MLLSLPKRFISERECYVVRGIFNTIHKAASSSVPGIGFFSTHCQVCYADTNSPSGVVIKLSLPLGKLSLSLISRSWPRPMVSAVMPADRPVASFRERIWRALSAWACIDIAFSKAEEINTSLTSTEMTLMPHGSVRTSSLPPMLQFVSVSTWSFAIQSCEG
jgi:hypothetical protein